MALTFKLGRFGRSKTAKEIVARKSRLGLRGSLFLAFAAIAATSMVIAGGASLLLGQLSGMNKALTEQDVPRLTTAMQLSELSESLASNGPTLLNAPTESMRQQQLKTLKETQASALARLNDLRQFGTDPKIVVALEENLKTIAGMTDNLDSAAKQRLETFAKREKQLDAVGVAHKAFLGVIEFGNHRSTFGSQLRDDDGGRPEGGACSGADGRHTGQPDVRLQLDVRRPERRRGRDTQQGDR